MPQRQGNRTNIHALGQDLATQCFVTNASEAPLRLVNLFVEAITPAYTGEQYVQQDDKRTRRFELRELRKELPAKFGATWNTRHYTAAELAQIAADKSFSPAARSAAAFLASPAGQRTLERLNAKSGSKADARFKATDLEGVNRELSLDRQRVVANSALDAKMLLGDTSRRLADSYNSAITSVIQQHVVQPNSVRIE